VIALLAPLLYALCSPFVAPFQAPLVALRAGPLLAPKKKLLPPSAAKKKEAHFFPHQIKKSVAASDPSDYQLQSTMRPIEMR
jgi:hypothetical protein